MDAKELRKFVDATWDDSIVPTLVDYIKIPNKSPDFDPDWEANGHMEKATQMIAEWCRRPIVLAPGCKLTPLVLGPDKTPLVRDFDEAAQCPELAILSALTHPTDVAAAQAALHGAILSDDERATVYGDILFHILGPVAARAWEQLMANEKREYQSDFAKKYYSEGRSEGRSAGLSAGRRERRVATLRKQLALKFGSLAEEHAARIEAATEQEIERFTERILSADSIEAVLEC